MTRYPILFISTFAVFLFFLTPNVNTGDAGELVTSSHYMGIAHPSGYPLYLQLGKMLTLLPLGNMAFKVALVSAMFSSLCLTLVCYIIYRLTENENAAFFTTAALLVSYSFFTQSVIAKFYPLNLFIILLIFSSWIWVFLTGYDKRILYLSSFLLGVTTANHHTGLIMLAPVFIASLFYRKAISWRDIFISLVLLFSGFLINGYMLIRGSGEHFFNATPVNNIKDFASVFFRLRYEGASSIAAAGSAVSKAWNYWFALKNFIKILTANFSVFSYPLFFAGIFYLYKTNRKVLMLCLLSLVLYGPFLAKITLSGQKISEESYYISANQYFLPGIAFYVIFLGIGFHQGVVWLRNSPLKLVSKILPVVFAVFPLVFLVSRAADSNYRTNYVAYQHVKDSYTIVPANSIVLAFGDDAIYQGWYIKTLGRYREDICHLGADEERNAMWMLQGCNKKLYGDVYPDIYNMALNKMVPLMLKNRFYASNTITSDFAFKKYLHSTGASLLHLYLPNDDAVNYYFRHNPEDTESFLFGMLLNAEKLISPQVCLSHLTDDFLTRLLCTRYAIHFFEIARRYAADEHGKTGLKANIEISVSTLTKDRIKYSFDVTKRNKPYLLFAKKIQKYNQWKILYIRED